MRSPLFGRTLRDLKKLGLQLRTPDINLTEYLGTSLMLVMAITTGQNDSHLKEISVFLFKWTPT